MLDQDVRLQQVEGWLDDCLPALFVSKGWGAVPEGSLTPASSDASFRRYFRWQAAGRSLIVMDAPPPQENCRPFVRIAQLLADIGVHVPRILACDIDRGFLLLDDLGTKTWLEILTPENADAMFDAALKTLVRFQRLPAGLELPYYDNALLRRELQLFPEWYLQRHLGIDFNETQRQQWQQVCDVLVNSALAQARVFVHRDYMPRNLMLSEPNPGVLDFQDAVYGPVSYDATSLFKDAFLSWPEPQVERWLLRYWALAREQGIAVPDDFQAFHRDCDLMGVQRHLKVIGIFARICHRDGKPRYLADVPRFFDYLNAVLARRPELAVLGELLASLPKEKPPL